MAQLKSTIVTGDLTVTDKIYGALVGNAQMTGPLTWQNDTALPELSSASYFLAIDSFASGGTTKWITAANARTSIGALSTSTQYAASSSVGGPATNATTTADTTNSMYLVGVKSNATTTLLHDTSISMQKGTLTIGSREVTTTPSAETSVDRLIITPYFYTNGPWKIASTDDTSTAYLKLSYGSTELTRISNIGVMSITSSNGAGGSSNKNGILNLKTTASLSSGWAWGINHLATNMTAGNTCIMTGVADSTNNAGVLEFHYEGSGNAGNYVGISLYANNGLLKVFPSGQVNITSTAAASVTITNSVANVDTAALNVAGGIFAGASSYFNAGIHIRGAASDDPLMVRGIAGCSADGKSRTTQANKGLYLNYNGGPVYLGRNNVTADATNALIISYTTAASSTTSGALQVSGGAGIAGKLYVNSGLVTNDLEVGVTAGTISRTNNNLILNAPTSYGVVFQQNSTNKIWIVGDSIYHQSGNTGALGSTSAPWKRLYLSSQDNANTEGIMFYNTSSVLQSRIGSNVSGGLGLYAHGTLYFKPNYEDTNHGVQLSYATSNNTVVCNFLPTTDNDVSLGSSGNSWKQVCTKCLNITSDAAIAHINFSRTNWSYFNAPSGGGKFAFSIGGASGSYIKVGIDSDALYCYSANNLLLGKTGVPWTQVYASAYTIPGLVSGSTTSYENKVTLQWNATDLSLDFIFP